MWSPWKCEMITASTVLRVDAGGGKVGVELAQRALALLELRGPQAGVDDDELGAGVHDDRRERRRPPCPRP